MPLGSGQMVRPQKPTLQGRRGEPAGVITRREPQSRRRVNRGTRIIVPPGEVIVRKGPYRWVDHPNYIVVVAEIAVLPLLFRLWGLALIFSLLNSAVLAIRIREENRALGR